VLQMPIGICKPFPALVVLEPQGRLSEILKHINKPEHTFLVPRDMDRDYFFPLLLWCVIHSRPFRQMLRVYQPLPITKIGFTGFENIETAVVGGVEGRRFYYTVRYVSQIGESLSTYQVDAFSSSSSSRGTRQACHDDDHRSSPLYSLLPDFLQTNLSQ
jgi:hypothetical protein